MTVETPECFDVGAAWSTYQKLMQEAAGDPKLFADLQHSCARARTWGRWRDLFLASSRNEGAAG